ncbi:MAG: 3-ketoacyl-ACP reductase [Fidelibacterota bacterium]|nr:MAG: 3-ketoacyl-ACP reductase [Candidatus Neomarinimicrobiota bacterium]
MGKKQVALITGAARGIGFEIARSLAKEGYNLAIDDICEVAAFEEGRQVLEDLGAEVAYCKADISDGQARDRLLQEVKKTYGRLDVLVNNAGVAPLERKDILEATEESFERLIRINLQGPYFLTQLAARWMLEQKRSEEGFSGCIIFITSVSASAASPERGEYCISKAGLSMASRLWAVRLGELDIPVYEVRPGIIRTDMTAGVKDKYDKLFREGLALQRRWGEPEDVGRAVAALVRGDLGYSTGQIIMVEGGMTVGRF